MESFPLGRFSVGRIGFGAIQLPGRAAFGPPRDRDAALAVLRRAVELGVNHIDTAQFYGPGVSNELIREALHPYPVDLALVSKVGARRRRGWKSVVQQERNHVLPSGQRLRPDRHVSRRQRQRVAMVKQRIKDAVYSGFARLPGDCGKPGDLQVDLAE